MVRKRIEPGNSDILCSVCETRSPINLGAEKVRAAGSSTIGELFGLRKIIEEKKRRSIDNTKREMNSIRESMQPAPGSQRTIQAMETDSPAMPIVEPTPIRILHLSDLHFDRDSDPIVSLQPLVRDVRNHDGGLGFSELDYLVISGDLTNRASTEEFESAHEFISALIEQCGLSAARCIIVPGNHDLNWDVEGVYRWHPARKVEAGQLKAGVYVKRENDYLIRDDSVYQSSINQSGLAAGLMKANAQLQEAIRKGSIEKDDSVLRIAVWHHPVTGNEKIMQDAFLDQLRQEGVKLGLHGHVHEERTDVIGYLHPRRLFVAGAGSFGAPVRQRPESTPRLYNLIEVWRDQSKVRIHTRCLRKDGGAWEGWAVWPGEGKTARNTHYEIPLDWQPKK